MQTIYYVSDLKWFGKITSDRYSSKKEMVEHHLKYISEKAEQLWLDRDKFFSDIEKADKRVNSRVAVSFVFAIPNNLDDEQVRNWIEDIRDLLSSYLEMDKESVVIAYHNSIGVSGGQNKHFHILLPNLNREGKSIKLGRDRLKVKELHNILQNYIKMQGYEIRKEKEKQEHIGTRLRWDKELAEEYRRAVRLKRELSEIDKKIEEELDKMVSLEFAKQHINLVELAVNKFGYRIDKRKSSKYYKTLKKDNDVIVVKRNNENNHWIYFNARNDEDNGTVIDFLQNRGVGNLGAVRRFLANYIKEKKEGKIKEVDDFEVRVSSISDRQNVVLREYSRLGELEEDNYLVRDRQIDPGIINKDFDIYTDDRKNVVFPLFGKQGEVIGLAKYNKDFKQVIGQKGIWTSYTGKIEDVKGITDVVITESPIDALSYLELFKDETDIYIDVDGTVRNVKRRYFLISTQGQIGKQTIEAISNYIKAIKKVNPNIKVRIALDNDDKGQEMAEELQEELENRFNDLEIYVDIPQMKDWNEELQEEKKEGRDWRRKWGNSRDTGFSPKPPGL